MEMEPSEMSSKHMFDVVSKLIHRCPLKMRVRNASEMGKTGHSSHFVLSLSADHARGKPDWQSISSSTLETAMQKDLRFFRKASLAAQLAAPHGRPLGYTGFLA